MVLIDLQESFDTVNRDILKKKMEFIFIKKSGILGFPEETTKLLKSYLPNRKFTVHIKACVRYFSSNFYFFTK